MSEEKKKRKKLSNNDYKLLARKMKSAGFTNVDLRKREFSAYQKRKLRNLAKDSHKMSIANFFHAKKTKKSEYENLVHAKKTGSKKDILDAEKEFFKGHKHGLTEFRVRTVKDKKKLKDFENNGYLVIKNKVYIKTEFGHDAHIKKLNSPLTGNKVTVIETTFKGKKSIRYIEDSLTFLKELEAMKNNPLPEGVHAMVAVGENNPIGKSESVSYADLMKYIELWAPKDSNVSKENLINQMSIVYLPAHVMGK